jgi:SAM-dependent methyltransferase
MGVSLVAPCEDERVDVEQDWYEGWFEGDWLDQIALRFPPEQAVEAVDFIVERLGLEHGARVLDVACGHGRHANELARRGMRVTGVDASPRSLDIARETAAAEGLDVGFRELDMRELDYDGEFDAAICLFTSFGFFDEAGNQRVLDGVARALRPEGSFLIDVVNGLALFRFYKERPWEELDDDVLFVQEHEYDALAGRNRSRWIFVRPDGTRSELRHSLRVYTPVELAERLRVAGLEVEGGWGGWDGTDLGFEGRRLILVARRP